MMSYPYRLGADSTVINHAVRVTAIVTRYRSHFLRMADRAGVVVARLQALERSSRGLDVATILPAMYRPVPPRGELEAIAGLSPTPAERIVSAISRHSSANGVSFTGGSQRLPIVRTARAFLSAKAAGARKPLPAGSRLTSFDFAINRQREITPRFSDKATTTAATGRTAAQSGQRLAARALLRENPHRPPLLLGASISDHLGRHSAGLSPQRTDAPGFNRTVRQHRGAAPAGHVYLDKALVGYHLAAAITAEQTRAASRPNISGSAFNSSMAALRPSGAAL